MKRNHRRVALHRRRRVSRSRFPYVRYATVTPSANCVDSPPCLRLHGDWLSEAGFFTHWRVKVSVRRGRLVIEPLIDVLGLFAEYEVGGFRSSKNCPNSGDILGNQVSQS